MHREANTTKNESVHRDAICTYCFTLCLLSIEARLWMYAL